MRDNPEFDYHFYENTKEWIKVINIEPLEDYTMRIYFSNGEVKMFDFNSYLDSPAFKPLKDKSFFNSVKVKHGTAFWTYDRKSPKLCNDIDIAPNRLYWDSVSV